jgi:hypothetical protein
MAYMSPRLVLPPSPITKDRLGEGHLDDLQRAAHGEPEDRLVEAHEQDLAVAPEVGQAVEVLATRAPHAEVRPVAGGPEPTGNGHQERSRQQVAGGIDGEGHADPELPGDETTEGGTQGEHHRPGRGAEGVGGAEFALADHHGQQGVAGREEHAGE